MEEKAIATKTRKKSWDETLREFVQRRPTVLLRVPGADAAKLAACRNGLSEFTFIRPHEDFGDFQTPCLCLVFAGADADQAPLGYAAVLKSRKPVSNLDTRIKVARTVLIAPKAAEQLLTLLDKRRFVTDLQERLASDGTAVSLPPKLSLAVLDGLLKDDSNHGPLRSVAGGLVKAASGTIESLQSDAVETALKAFGLTSDAVAVDLDLRRGRETSLVRARVMEDAVIEHDARQVPGYDLVGSDFTGRATFRRRNETLEVLTANRNRLEEAFGVDLIYFHVLHQSIVMVQYKMLEPSGGEEGTEWVYRQDSHLEKQLATMRAFKRRHAKCDGGYRLNREAFYFKFVRRMGPTVKTNVLLPLEHFDELLRDERFHTRSGAVKVTYSELGGQYMRQTAFFSLLQSGYIGSDAETTQQLHRLLEDVVDGNDAVVIAIQRLTTKQEHESDRQRMVERYFDD